MSSVITSASYDRDTATMRVAFTSGGVYTWRISPAKWADYQKAASKGAWIGKNLRHRKHRKIG